jgi:hypothetical protein
VLDCWCVCSENNNAELCVTHTVELAHTAGLAGHTGAPAMSSCTHVPCRTFHAHTRHTHAWHVRCYQLGGAHDPPRTNPLHTTQLLSKHTTLKYRTVGGVGGRTFCEGSNSYAQCLSHKSDSIFWCSDMGGATVGAPPPLTSAPLAMFAQNVFRNRMVQDFVHRN